jgi:hypothetical protein
MKMSGYLHAPAALPPGRNIGTQLIGSWAGPRARRFEEVLGFETRTVKSVVAIPTALIQGKNSLVASHFDDLTRKRSC